jgi:hypothetical protein
VWSAHGDGIVKGRSVELPESGSVSLAAAVEHLATARDRYASGDRILARAAFVRSKPRSRAALAIVCRPISSRRGIAADMRIKAFQFQSKTIQARKVATPESFLDFVRKWPAAAVDTSKLTGQGDLTPFHCTRQSSRSRWSTWPGWLLRASPAEVVRWDQQLASGPFVVTRHNWIGRSLTELFERWSGVPEDVPPHINFPLLYVLIPDHRGCLTSINRDANELICTVEGSAAKSVVGISYSDLSGQSHNVIAGVKNGLAKFRLSRAPQDLAVELWHADQRTVLDRYAETRRGSTWGQSVLLTSTGVSVPESLAEAIESGESTVVEFKPFTELTFGDDSKAMELVETAVSFANAQGGRIYVGVDDHGAILGCDDGLRKWKKTHSLFATGAIVARDSYVDLFDSELRRRVHPTVAPSYRWLDAAAGSVLEITIACGAERPYEVLHKGPGFFLRAGATNRRMTREELEIRFRREAAEPTFR